MRQLYERLILPRLIHFGMSDARFRPFREAVVAGAHGRVLELGIGSGLNLPHYGREVRELVGIDTSADLLARAARQGGWMNFHLRLIRQSAEALPFETASFDCVVVSWALCSIPNVEAALAEARRVLRPGGRLQFVEHGMALNEPGVARWQRRLTPLWRCCAGGCHLDRQPDVLLEAAGFRLERLETGHLLAGPRLLTFHYRGVATP